MKGRHTPIKGSLTRSFGADGSEDLVVELRESGHVVFRREPMDRRIKRGEQLPEKVVDVESTMQTLSAPDTQESSVAEILEEILRRAPIAKIEGDRADKIAYNWKVWLLEELRRIINKHKEESCSD